MKHFTQILLCLVTFTQIYGQSNISEIWALDDGERVQRNVNNHFMQTDPNNIVWKDGAVNIFGARNETVAFQLVIEAGSTTLPQVGAYLDSLKNGTEKISNTGWSGGLFDYRSRRIEAFVAHYKLVNSRMPDGTTGLANGTQPKPDSYYLGWMPNVLIPAEAETTGTAAGKIGGMPFRVPRDSNQTVWFDIYIPKGTTPGLWTGNIRILESGVQTTTVPVRLIVYNFTLPDTNHALWVGNVNDSKTRLEYIMGSAYAYNTATYWAEHFKIARFFHRHRLDYHLGHLNYSDLTTGGNWGSVFTGTAYTSANQYDGPGVNVGNQLQIIMCMDHTLSHTPGTPSAYKSTRAWEGTNEANWRIESDRWENWFAANAPNAMRVAYIHDEIYNFDWDGDGTKMEYDAGDTTIAFSAVRQMAGWLRNNPGPGNLLGRMSAGPVWRPRMTGTSGDQIDGTMNNITHQSTTNIFSAMGAPSKSHLNLLFGIHTIAHPSGMYTDLGKERGAWENVQDTKVAQGDSLSFYNNAYPGFGLTGWEDFEVTASRWPFWVMWRYPAVDYWWTWDVLSQFQLSSNWGDPWTKAVPFIRAGANGPETEYEAGSRLSTLIYPGKSNRYVSHNVDGPCATYTVKALRRGVQDYEYLWLARELGVLDTNLARIVVPRALDDFGDAYTSFIQPCPIKRRGYDYEAVRKSLALALDAGSTVVGPQGTFAATPTYRDNAGTLEFRWTVDAADSAKLIRPGKSDSTVTVRDTANLYVAATETWRMKWWRGTDTSSATASFTVGAVAVELLSNVSWESGTTGWTYQDNSNPVGAYTRQTSPTPYHNSYLARVVLPAAYNHATYPQVQLVSAAFTLTGGKPYRLRTHIYGSAASSIRILVQDNDGPSYGFAKTYSFGSSGWLTIDTTFFCSATGTVNDAIFTFRYRLGTNTYTTAGTTVYHDSTSLVEVVPLVAPTMTLPVNGTSNVDIPTTFSWTPVSGATEYQLQLDRTDDFTNLVKDTSGITGTSTQIGGLDGASLYYARVRGKNGLGAGPWSDFTAFVTLTGSLPAPTLTSPANNKTAVSRSPLLEWVADTRASQYEVQVTTDTVTWDVDTALTTTNAYAVLGSSTNPTLGYLTDYFWRVRCLNSEGAGAWSETRKFRTGSALGLRDKKTGVGTR